MMKALSNLLSPLLPLVHGAGGVHRPRHALPHAALTDVHYASDTEEIPYTGEAPLLSSKVSFPPPCFLSFVCSFICLFVGFKFRWMFRNRFRFQPTIVIMSLPVEYSKHWMLLSNTDIPSSELMAVKLMAVNRQIKPEYKTWRKLMI